MGKHYEVLGWNVFEPGLLASQGVAPPPIKWLGWRRVIVEVGPVCVVVSARRPPLASVFIFPPATEQVSHHPEYFLVRCNAALAPYIPPCWLLGAVDMVVLLNSREGW